LTLSGAAAESIGLTDEVWATFVEVFTFRSIGGYLREIQSS